MKKQIQVVNVKNEDKKKNIVKVQPAQVPATPQQDPGGCRPTGT